tara:strand:- start:139 stop:1836 length:1698 start_codon:yes stop_codon:yes gene_type:complete
MFANLPITAATSLVLGLSLMGCTAPTPSEAPWEQSAQAIIEPWVSTDAPGVSVAVSIDGEVVFARGAGMANLEHDLALTPGSVFQVASVSKQFTAFAALLLVSEGKVGLDVDIRTYIPELALPPQTITVRHLLDHTGGLREQGTLTAMAGWLDDDIRTREQVLEMITRQRGVNFEAGAEVEYSNTGYILLAEIVARVSETAFEDFAASRIFEPLGMTDTRFQASRNTLIPGRAASYYPSENGFSNIVAAGEVMGSTGLYTSALDLLKWAGNFETRQVGDDFVFDQMAQRSAASNGDASTFGRGQELRPYNGLQTWSHGGRDAGYRSFILRVPEESFALSIVSNRTDFDTAKMAFALVDAFLSDASNYQEEADPVWEDAAPAELASYAGNYEMYPGVIFTIAAVDEGLTFAPLGTPAGEGQLMPQIGPREFSLSPQADISLVFEAPEHGRSESFGYQIGLHGALPGSRIELAAFDPALAELSDYVGRYRSTELGTSYELTLEDGALVAKHQRRPGFPLTPYQDDIFAGLSGPLQRVEFIRDDAGVVTGMLASAPLAERVVFERSGL